MVNYAVVSNLLEQAQIELDGGDMQSERIAKAIGYLLEVVQDEEYRAPPGHAGSKVIPFPQHRVGART
jgi:hypothetical protein